MPRKRPKAGSRSIAKHICVFCESAKDKSESAYFKAFIRSLRLPGKMAEVVDSKDNTGKKLVSNAIKHIKNNKNDEVWVVYDKDSYDKHAETFATARAKNIKIAFSSISFEEWILLHYKYTAHFFSSSGDIIKYMKNHGWIDYKKSSASVFNETCDKLEFAKENAKKLQVHQRTSNPENTPVYELNPYTDVNELIEEIQKLVKKKR